jgi:hypothetical protein
MSGILLEFVGSSPAYCSREGDAWARQEPDEEDEEEDDDEDDEEEDDDSESNSDGYSE